MDRYLSLVPRTDEASITMFVGENGAGKSMALAALASELLRDNRNVIAVSNTVFDRLPRGRRAGYTRLSPTIGSSYATRIFKRALLSGQNEMPRNGEMIGKSLQYVGFDPIIGVSVRFREPLDTTKLQRSSEAALSQVAIADIARAFDLYQRNERSTQTTWIDLYASSYGAEDRRDLFNILKYESALRKAGVVHEVSLSLMRDGRIYPLIRASSGELSLLATYVCLATHVSEGVSMLIDEPENSLHPKWQKEYCDRLLDQFHYYSPQIVIATHSPQIVQGAESAGVSTRLIKMPNEQAVSTPLTKSIEGTLVEAFGILSPANHYLSEKVTYLLNELAQKRASLEHTTQRLSFLRSLSTDEGQIEFLEQVTDLASRIATTITGANE